jgi:hypothetical protein
MRFLAEVLRRFVEDVEARPADAMTRHERVLKLRLRLGGNDLSDVVQQLVEERPAVLRLDRFELLDVDEDDADLSLLDEHFLHAIEHDRQRRKRRGAIEEQRFQRGPARLIDAGAPVARTIEHGPHALDDFVAIERLDEVVVGADLQAGEAVFHIAAAGDENHADARGALHGLERLADFPAAALRHHHVEQHSVRQARLRHRQRLFAIARGQYLALERLEKRPQQQRDLFVIIGDQHDRPGHTLRGIIAENRPSEQDSRQCASLQ